MSFTEFLATFRRQPPITGQRVVGTGLPPSMPSAPAAPPAAQPPPDPGPRACAVAIRGENGQLALTHTTLLTHDQATWEAGQWDRPATICRITPRRAT